MYNINNYNYKLPNNLIAKRPPSKRGDSRLLILNKNNGEISHNYFKNIDLFLKPSDVIVINDSKVIPARIFGKKITGGKVEVLILNFYKYYIKSDKNISIFKCLIKSNSSTLTNTAIFFDKQLKGTILNNQEGIFTIKFNNTKILQNIIENFGEIPLPPYIKKESKIENIKNNTRYQTIFAKKKGSIAAPTAGLHLTKKIIKKIKKTGASVIKITLHVGYGTFAPVKVQNIKNHKIHSEWFSINKDAANIINDAKTKGNRIIAVGTTTVRAIEFLAQKNINLQKKEGKCNLFIYPGYSFKIVDGIITNFHLPKSTLLMLISAFSNKQNILNAYKIAIKKKYRFFSYGDAMLIN